MKRLQSRDENRKQSQETDKNSLAGGRLSLLRNPFEKPEHTEAESDYRWT